MNAMENAPRNRGRNILLVSIIFVIAITAVILIFKPFGGNGNIAPDPDSQYPNNAGYVGDRSENNQQDMEQSKGAVEPGEDMNEIGAIRKLIVKGKTVYRRDNNGVAEYSYDEGETWTTTRPDQ